MPADSTALGSHILRHDNRLITTTIPVHEKTFGVDILANDTPYGLAGYFYSRDAGRIWRVADQLQTGIVGMDTPAQFHVLQPVENKQRALDAIQPLSCSRS